MSEYLKVDRPDKQYCDGCPALNSGFTRAFCMAMNITYIEETAKGFITLPNCPLIKFEDLPCGRCDAELDLWSTFLEGKKVKVENPTLPQSNFHTIED